MAKRRQGERNERRVRRDKSSARQAEAVRAGGRRVRWRWYVWMLAVLVVVGMGIGYAVSQRSGGVPGVVVPDGLDELDPQFRDVATRYIAWAQEAPLDADRRAGLGLVYAANRLWPEAKACFEAATRLDGGNVLARYYTALALRELDDAAGAVVVLRGIVDEHPEFAPALYRLGDAWLATGSLSDATSAFRRAVALAPDAVAGYVGLGDALLRSGDAAGAAAQLEHAIELQAGARQAHYLLGLAYRALGRMDAARRELSSGAGAVKVYLPDAWSDRLREHAVGVADQIGLALDYIDAGRPDRGVDILETALSWHPDNVDIMNNLGIAYLEQQRPERAEAVLLRANAIDDSRFETYINLSACAGAMQAYDRAVTYIDRAIDLAPEMAQAHITRARMLAQLGRREDARAALETAIRFDAENPEVYLELGNTCMQLGQFGSAKDHYAAAAMRFPSQWRAHVGLANACVRLGELDAALAAISVAERLVPENAQVAMLANQLRAAMDR